MVGVGVGMDLKGLAWSKDTSERVDVGVGMDIKWLELEKGWI